MSSDRVTQEIKPHNRYRLFAHISLSVFFSITRGQLTSPRISDETCRFIYNTNCSVNGIDYRIKYDVYGPDSKSMQKFYDNIYALSEHHQ